MQLTLDCKQQELAELCREVITSSEKVIVCVCIGKLFALCRIPNEPTDGSLILELFVHRRLHIYFCDPGLEAVSDSQRHQEDEYLIHSVEEGLLNVLPHYFPRKIFVENYFSDLSRPEWPFEFLTEK